MRDSCDSWLKVVDCVLRPLRPDLERCLREREVHVAARRLVAERRARTIASCEARIESARAAVFTAQDGVVSSRMTDLEREWRRLSRSDPDAGLMDLWARIAPASWIDRKRWRDSDRDRQLDAAIALASDVEGVEAAESAIDSLRIALAAPRAAPIGPRIRWRSSIEDGEPTDFEGTDELLAEPLRGAREALTAHAGARADARAQHLAQQLHRDVHEAARARFPERPVLARALAHAAFVDCFWRAAPRAEHPNPVTPLRELWTAGYVLSAVDASGVTVAIPRL